jgi:hypothetical protein
MLGRAWSPTDMCKSEDTNEKSATSPASAQASRGKRVLMGRLPTILNIEILPQCAAWPINLAAPPLFLPRRLP